MMDGMPIFGAWGLFLALIVIVPVWRIFDRAGLAPALSLLIFIPVVGPFVAAGLLALTSWDQERDDDESGPPPAAATP